MTTNYICLDDEAGAVEGLIQVLVAANETLSIELRPPTLFDDEIKQISKSGCHGLLLDLRLDKTPSPDGTRVNYRAISLAQELRTRMTEGAIPSIPLVLWSVDANFQESYDRDKTGHDLFDFHFSKRRIDTEANKISQELVALAKGYAEINTLRSRTIKNIYARLIDLEDEFEVLDVRLANHIATERSFPTHVFADSLLNDLIRCSGPLVNQEHLAARLGVNYRESEDWTKLISKFAKDAKYTGVFGDNWPRWWMYKIIRNWNQIHTEAPLQRLKASQRVEILRKKYKLKNLVAYNPIADGYDEKFWNVCYLTGKPVSPVNSVRLSLERPEWQDGVFASLQSVLEREHKAQDIQIHPFEIDRVKGILADLKNE